MRGALEVPSAHLPFCLNADRSRITSFASRDGQYRLYACDVCERYFKAYDARQRLAAGHARGGFSRDAAAGRGRDSEGIPVMVRLKSDTKVPLSK